MKIAASSLSIAVTITLVVAAYWAGVRTYQPIEWQWTADSAPQAISWSIL